jgi:hypothetical protein
VLVLGGCGSGSATKKDVIAQANAICAAAQRDARAVAPPTGTSVSSVASYLARLAPVVENEAAQIRKLPRPKQDRALLSRWIGSVVLVAGDYRALATAARIGDRQAMETADAALRANPATELAARYGLRDCTGSAGTSAGS